MGYNKSALQGKFRAISAYIKKIGKASNKWSVNSSQRPRKTKTKPQISKQKTIIKKLEKKVTITISKSIQRSGEIKSWVFEKINKTGKQLVI